MPCTDRKPLCESWPLSDFCAARPKIWGTLNRLPRAENATCRYEGSNRSYRGWMLTALREAFEGRVTLHELGGSLREGFGEENLPWLRGVMESLQMDRLVNISSTEGWTRTIAEERAAYRDESRKFWPSRPCA